MKKLLLLRTDSLGDNILFSSLLPHIREKFKKWEIAFACKESVKPLYDFCPFLDEVIDINMPLRKNYDIAINSVYSRTFLSDSLTFASGAKKTIAFRGNNEYITPDKISEWEDNNKKYTKLIDIPLEHNSPEINKYYYLLKELGIKAKDLMPLVWTKPGSYPGKGHTVIFCGGGWPYKYVFNLGRALDDFIDNHTEIIALGGLYEWAVNQENLDAIRGGKKINLSGKTSLHEALDIVNKAKLVIGVDTGLAHAACALNKDNIILVGGGHPGRFFPYHQKTIPVRKELACYGCNWRCTIEKKIDCMNIPDEIIKEKIALKLKPVKKKNIKKRKHRGIVLTAIVSIYKGKKYIEGLLEDLLLQTMWKNMEVILVDCNSPDNEGEIIKKYTSKYNNIRYIRLNYNAGNYHARNMAIKEAGGKYITDANLKDRHRKDALEILVNTLEDNPDKVLAYAGFYITTEENDTFGYKHRFWIPRKFNYELLHKNCYIGPAPVWRKSVHNKYGYFDEDFLHGGDWEFWLRIAGEGFIEVNNILGLYLYEENSREYNNSEIAEKERDRVFQKYKSRMDLQGD